jgi:hypothetical protein
MRTVLGMATKKHFVSGREEENSEMEFLHERTLYDLCGFDNDE